MHAAHERHHAGAGQTAHGIAPLDVLDLDDLGAPLGEHGRRRRHECVLRHLQDADALHHRGHGVSFPLVRREDASEVTGEAAWRSSW